MTDQKLTALQQETKSLQEQARSYEVKTQVSYDMAGNFLKNCIALDKQIKLFFEPTINNFKKAKAQAEAGRKEETEKMNHYLKPVEEAILLVRNKCKEFENEAERLRIEQQKKLEEEAQKKTEVAKEWGEDAPVEVEEAKPVIEKSTGLGIRRTHKWKVVDASLIPREYLVIDEVAINKVVREQKEKTNINGIEVYYE